MTSLDAVERRQLKSLDGWTREAFAVVDAKVADAQAHLGTALTDTLKRTADGRPTLRRAVKSPSAQAAVNRLDELWTALAGPSVRSLEGLLRDAREAFYRESFAAWKPEIPDWLYVSPDPEPTVANVGRVRGAVLHGYDLRHELGGPILRAKASIAPTLTMASRRSNPRHVATEILTTWGRKTRDAIRTTTRLALSDSQIMADVMAGRDLIHPDHLDDSPIAIGA